MFYIRIQSITSAEFVTSGTLYLLILPCHPGLDANIMALRRGYISKKLKHTVGYYPKGLRNMGVCHCSSV